jgi:site-specific DNA recombinase
MSYLPPPSTLPPGSAVAAYLRDSGGDTQELSTIQQESEIRSWAAAQGLTIGRVFTDAARPGSSVVGRDHFLEMINYFQAGPVPEVGVVVWSSSRFGRNIDDAQFYRSDLRRRGYVVHSMTDPIPEGTTGQLVEFALAWKDQVFLEQLSGDVRRGLRHIVEIYGAMPGTPPAGFRRVSINVGQRRDGSPHILHRWEPDPETAPLARRAFEMRASGATLLEIISETGIYKKKAAYSRFFANRLYLGELVFGDLVIPGYCSPTVDQETWEAVQLINRSRSRITAGQHSPQRLRSRYLLSGLVRCQECGAIMNAYEIHGWQYYACSLRKAGGDCSSRSIRRELLEQEVVRRLLEDVLTLENLLKLQAVTIESYIGRMAEIEQLRATRTLRLRESRRAITNLVEAIAATGSSPALLEALRSAELERDNLVLELRQLEEQKPLAELPPVKMAILADGLRMKLQGDADSRRLAFRDLITRIMVRRSGNEIIGVLEYHLPKAISPPGHAQGKGDDAVTGKGAPTGAYTILLQIPIKRP